MAYNSHERIGIISTISKMTVICTELGMKNYDLSRNKIFNYIINII